MIVAEIAAHAVPDVTEAVTEAVARHAGPDVIEAAPHRAGPDVIEVEAEAEAEVVNSIKDTYS